MGFVYIGKGKNDRASKIGRTSKPEEERLMQHRTASPSFEYQLLIESIEYRKIETLLHHLFESKRVRETKEWFFLESSDIELASATAKTYETEELPMISRLEHLKSQETSNEFVQSVPSVEQDYLRLKYLDEQAFHIEREKTQIECRLKLQIGLNAGIDGYFSWKSQTRQVFNSSLFKKEHADTYKKYQHLSICRCFILM